MAALHSHNLSRGRSLTVTASQGAVLLEPEGRGLAQSHSRPPSRGSWPRQRRGWALATWAPGRAAYVACWMLGIGESLGRLENLGMGAEQPSGLSRKQLAARSGCEQEQLAVGCLRAWGNGVRVRVSCCNIYLLLVELDIGPDILGLHIHVLYILSISGSGMRVSGTRIGGHPQHPMGRGFSPLVSPWGANLTHPRSPMEEFLAGNRVSGPRCHHDSGAYGPLARMAAESRPKAPPLACVATGENKCKFEL